MRSLTSLLVATPFFVAATVHADPVSTVVAAGGTDRAEADAPGAPLSPKIETISSLEAADKAPRSIPRRTTGQVLTILGVAHLVAGGVFSAWAQYDLHVHPNPDNPGTLSLNTLLIGIPLLASGAGLSAVGIPLWVTGAESVPATRTAGARSKVDAQALVPRISLGAGSAALTIPF